MIHRRIGGALLVPALSILAWNALAEERASPRVAAGLATLSEIGPAVAACWHAPAGLTRLERVDVTVRFSLRRDGTVFGQPHVTFVGAPLEGRARELLTRSAVDAVHDCAPLRLTGGLGGAIAGRPITIHLIYRGPQGRGA